MRTSPLSNLALRSIAALSLLAQAVVHGQLWQDGYRSIDVIGPMFLAGVIGAVVLSVVVLVRPTFLGVTAALALSVGQVAALAMTKVTGLFGFMTQPGLTDFETTAVAAEVVAAVSLGALLLVGRNRTMPELVRAARGDESR